MNIKVGISNRHIHLNREDYGILFGNEPLQKRNDLSQIGEFASTVTITIKGAKGTIEKVRVIGPLREYTQVEVSKTDCYELGIDAPVRKSGNLDDAAEITIINKDISIKRKAAIISARHIHISKEEQKKYNLYSEKYKVKISNEKGGTLDNVYTKTGDNYHLELHIDTDDANANLIKQGDEVVLLTDD